MVRLLGKVAGMTGPLPERRTALAEEMCDLVDADFWMWVHTHLPQGSQRPTAFNVLHGRMSERQLVVFYENSYEPELQTPEMAPLLKLMRRGKPFTRRRSQMIDDRAWYDSPHVRLVRKPAGIDDFIFSLYPLGDDCWSAFGFHRTYGRPVFTPEQARMIHIIASEIPWLHHHQPPENANTLLPALTPRLCTVMGLLIEGYNRKQIANQLSLSEHTVRGYISDVYRHFKVRSHVELIQRFAQGNGQDITPPT
ncbi:LuxR C-terminal-related transcriptional regulator [Phycisphaerales bacterium AB-hyl4]|uniref:LuxR C-terminal-related transcriptional regulator n=1 Tax=Natronomicrosphaera hydrolytica TaxID=3242702 RepID=A0ABV4U127_9BACT